MVISRPLMNAGEDLTAAERDVLHRFVRGDSLREIGIARGSSLRTVANQVQSIYRKLGTRSRQGLARYLTGKDAGPQRLALPGT
jgi:DNA-binding CsgD family transcriptional regulator